MHWLLLLAAREALMPCLRVCLAGCESSLFKSVLFYIPQTLQFLRRGVLPCKIIKITTSIDSSLVFSASECSRAALGLASVLGWGHITVCFFLPANFLRRDTPCLIESQGWQTPVGWQIRLSKNIPLTILPLGKGSKNYLNSSVTLQLRI